MVVLDREGQIALGKSRLETASQKLGEELSVQFLASLAVLLTPNRVEALYLLISNLDYLAPEFRAEEVIGNIYTRFLREVRYALDIDKNLFAGVLNALGDIEDIKVNPEQDQ